MEHIVTRGFLFLIYHIIVHLNVTFPGKKCRKTMKKIQFSNSVLDSALLTAIVYFFTMEVIDLGLGLVNGITGQLL